MAEFRDVPTDTFDAIKKIVLKEQRKSVKLPILRKARETFVVEGTHLSVKKDELIICDIVSSLITTNESPGKKRRY